MTTVYFTVNHDRVDEELVVRDPVKLSGALKVCGPMRGHWLSDIHAARPSGTTKNSPTMTAAGGRTPCPPARAEP